MIEAKHAINTDDVHIECNSDRGKRLAIRVLNKQTNEINKTFVIKKEREDEKKNSELFTIFISVSMFRYKNK